MKPIPASDIPPRNIDDEEPELAYEDDIPKDDQPSVEDGEIERE